MLNFFKKKSPTGNQIAFKIGGMHCTSCSLNIDDALEDTDGVIKAETSYAKSKSVITYDPTKVKPEKLKTVIEALKYTAAVISN